MSRCIDKDLWILLPALDVAVILACVFCYRAKMAMGLVIAARVCDYPTNALTLLNVDVKLKSVISNVQR